MTETENVSSSSTFIRQGKNVLVESTDLAHWSFRTLAPEVERPLSVEFDGHSYYLGLADGTVSAATLTAD